MRGVKKTDLPTKVCPTCQRPFSWRKKWERCLPKAVQLAEEMGTLLGGGTLLQRRLPPRHPARHGTKKPGVAGL